MDVKVIELRILDFEPSRGGRVELRCDDGSREEGTLPILPAFDLSQGYETGIALFQWLFSHPSLAHCWAELRGRYPNRRLHLNIDPAHTLHQLPWELLRDPQCDAEAALAEQETTPFSRYTGGRSPGPIKERPIRMLVVIADPEDLKDHGGLFPISRDTESKDLEHALRGAAPGSVVVDYLTGPCTLEMIERQIRRSPGYHVLHFIGHGQYKDGHSWLFLADENNQIQLVEDTALQLMFRNVLGDGIAGSSLRLVYLSSCETASQAGWVGLAPALIDAGVPTVVAMHGKVPVKSARQFSRVFYQELLACGEVDRASNRARATLRTTAHRGADIPVLYSRLLDGLLFAEPDKQVDLEDLHRFLLQHYDARGLSRFATELGVSLPPVENLAAQVRALIRSFESARRIDVLVAEAMSGLPEDTDTLRRTPLSDVLRERVKARANSDSQFGRRLVQLRRLEQAIAGDGITEEAAGTLLAHLKIALQRIRAQDATLDASDLPGLAERLDRFLETSGNTELYRLSVAAPMIALLLNARESTNLPAGELRVLRRSWERLCLPPVWKRPGTYVGVVAVFTLVALLIAEVGWRLPWRVWPADALASLPTHSWHDDLVDSTAAQWNLQLPKEAVGQVSIKNGEMHIPAGAIAFARLPTGELYDFALRFNAKISPGTKFCWYLRARQASGRIHGWQVSLTAETDKIIIERRWCAENGCSEPDPRPHILKSPLRDAVEIQLEATISGKSLVQAFNLFDGGNKLVDDFRADFPEVGSGPPRVLSGGLAFEAVSGPLTLTQELSIYPESEAQLPIQQ